MKKLACRFTAFLLALFVFLGALPTAAFCDEAGETKGYIAVLCDTAKMSYIRAEIERLTCGSSPLELTVFFRALAFEATSDVASRIEKLDGVVGVYADTEYAPCSLDESTDENGYRTIYAPTLEADTDKSAGGGAVVAVLDDGFDIDHPALKPREGVLEVLTQDGIAKQLHFTKASRLFNYSTLKRVYKNEKIPFAFDYAERDTDVYVRSSHGTAMASIAVGNHPTGSFYGAAPSAQLLAMKVYSDKDDIARTSTIVAALEDAYLLGADSVCLSLGAPCGASNNGEYGALLESVIEKLTSSGIAVACAAGNESSLGSGSVFGEHYGYDEPLTSTPDNGTVNTPSTLDGVLSVASSDSYVGRAYAFELAGTGVYVPYSDSNASTKLTDGKPFNLYFDGQTFEYAVVDGLGRPEELASLELDGKVALIKRGELSFVEKINNAADRGAIAVIIYDNEQGETPSIRTAMQLEGARLPAVLISLSDGELMAAASDKRIYIDSKVIYVTDAGITPSPSSFSSRGPTPTLDIKPELAAPGNKVSAASIGGGYTQITGTSASAAYAAGVAARVAAALSLTSEQKGTGAVKTVLMNTSVPMSDVVDGRYRYYSVTLQGAGNISPVNASRASVLAAADTGARIALGNDIKENFTITFELENLSDTAQELSLSTLIGSESYEKVKLGELASKKDRFYKENGIMLNDYLGLSGDDTVSFTGEFIDELVSTSVKYELRELNRASESFDGASITLSPHEKRNITLEVHLDESEMSAITKVYENGAYIEGYIFVEGDITYSVPFLGFYGDLYANDPFDASAYEKGGEFGGVYLYTFYADEYKDHTQALGGVADDRSVYMRLCEELNVISSVADGAEGAVFLHVALLRDLASLRATVYNEEGERVGNGLYECGLKKAYRDSSTGLVNTYGFKLWDSRDAENPDHIYDDGKYTVKLVGTDTVGREFYRELSFTLDSRPPSIDEYSVVERDGEKQLELVVSDEVAPRSVTAYAFNMRELEQLEGSNFTQEENESAGASQRVVFDIDGMEGQFVYIELCDLAYNKSIVRIKV